MMELMLTINGLETVARYDDETVSEILLPLLETLTLRQHTAKRRLVVFLAAPPATGKSTLASFLEHLSAQQPGCAPLQALGLDGFHYHQDYILTHNAVHGDNEIPMQLIKGAPETFDVEKLRRALATVQTDGLRWPLYDRRLHDVVENAIPVHGDILLLEGNWLLLSAPEWASLPRDMSVFIRANAALLQSRLIDRKLRGGFSREEAEAHYRRSDGPNVLRCLNESLPADVTLELTPDGGYRRIQ